ncbi:thiamine transporter SLC35F3 [Caerostris extrusa]|uniref:Thiamine transporter SLC35F3 n=1 Tax=Caerostris extrusa TaxID=172846 RepID=A0AAV4PJR6_CAEEX|nr:thiamine transporter SLC35F3 [Caerostris extrusa]
MQHWHCTFGLHGWSCQDIHSGRSSYGLGSISGIICTQSVVQKLIGRVTIGQLSIFLTLVGSAAFFITGNVLGNFDIAHNYNTYLSIGMLAAVPVSAVLDVHLHNVVFEGMKLAGILLICIGFLLVLLPDNWPDYITRLVRWRCRRIPKSKPADPSQPKARRIFMRPS